MRQMHQTHRARQTKRQKGQLSGHDGIVRWRARRRSDYSAASSHETAEWLTFFLFVPIAGVLEKVGGLTGGTRTTGSRW